MTIQLKREQLRPRSSGDPRSSARKPLTKGEALGQVFTTEAIALNMIHKLGISLEDGLQNLLDPCVGPATFPKALSRLGLTELNIDTFDIDPVFVEYSRKWSKQAGLRVNCKEQDYLLQVSSKTYSYAVLNPPYVRQEWIDKKSQYQEFFKKEYSLVISGTSNLYVYFIVKAMQELEPGGKLACIVYDSWQSTHFGKWLKSYLDDHCEYWTAEAAPPQPFVNQMIDATIIYARKRLPGPKREHPISASSPDPYFEGVTELSNLFATKRGLRLKQASFFMADSSFVSSSGATPFIKKIGLVPGYSISDDHPEAALLTTGSGVHDERLSRVLDERLMAALKDPSKNIPVLTWYKERPSEWSRHSAPPSAPLIFNYYLRKRPRHLRTNGIAFSDNFYGLTPLNGIPVMAWLAALNASLSVIGLMAQARNQGAGLAKLQLFEYRRSKVLDLRSWAKIDLAQMEKIGLELVNYPSQATKTIDKIDDLVAAVFGRKELSKEAVLQALSAADARARKPKGYSN